MSRWYSYLNTGKTIIEDFDGRSPLAVWLKEFFRQHKQMGSRDRKIVAELVYGYYRLGHSAPMVSLENKLLCALFICNNSSNELLNNVKPDWNNNIGLTQDEKKLFLKDEGLQWDPENIFPWREDVSDDVEHHSFTLSHLHQPNLYLRLRPLKTQTVIDKLTAASISFTILSNDCLMLRNATKIDEVLKIDEEAIIQDYNSQRTGDFIDSKNDARISVWDCCAGSGGKSIMAYDANPEIDLSVSDSRASILQNLSQRFQRAGIADYRSFVADLTTSKIKLPEEQFDYIISDVPCSGSGTWARTPEQLKFFNHKRIKYYSDLQKNIVSNVIPKLRKGGKFSYITCSVFKEENENLVEFVTANFGVALDKMKLLKGYEMKANTLFAATFTKC